MGDFSSSQAPPSPTRPSSCSCCAKGTNSGAPAPRLLFTCTMYARCVWFLALKSSKIDFKPKKGTSNVRAHIRHCIICCIIYGICNLHPVCSCWTSTESTCWTCWIDLFGAPWLPWSLCPFRPRCHHFRPCPFLSLLGFYTFHLPRFRGKAPGR